MLIISEESIAGASKDWHYNSCKLYKFGIYSFWKPSRISTGIKFKKRPLQNQRVKEIVIKICKMLLAYYIILHYVTIILNGEGLFWTFTIMGFSNLGLSVSNFE